jgi:hypothetical protein
MSLFRAIQSLRPDTEFTMYGDDIKDIVWHTEGVTTPTQEEIDAKITEIDAEIEAKANARQSALSKLAALGLTADEIASL